MKKVLFLVIIACIVLTIAACQKPKSEVAPATAAATTTAATKAADTTTQTTVQKTTNAPATSQMQTTTASIASTKEETVKTYDKPLKVSICVTEAEKHGTHARNEFIKDKFNLTFEYVPVNNADWNERIRTWVATDDTPDLIFWNLKGAQSNEYKTWARQGAFTPMQPEWFAENRPNLNRVYKSSPSIKALSVDGTLYSWPSMRDTNPDANNCYGSNWCYRRDWAQKVGLYKDNDTYTWDEWVNLIRAVLTEDPGKNGPGVTAGLVMYPAMFPCAASLFINPPAAEGNETCTYIKVGDKYVWPPATDDYKKSVKITYDMYQEGLIFKDNILFNSREDRDMIMAGLAFATYNVNGSLNSITESMLKSNIIEKEEDFGIAIIIGYDGVWYMTQTEDYWCITAFSRKITGEKIERVLDFWDWIMTDDGIRLRWLGIEGKDFKRTGPNLRHVELLWAKDEASGRYINPYANYLFNEAISAEGNKDNAPGSVPYQYNEIARLWKTRGTTSIPKAIKPFDYYVAFGSAPNKDQYGNFGTDTKTEIIRLMAQPGINIEAEWDKYVAGMMPKVQLVLDEINGGQLK